jgi:hypothetical protein
MAILFIDVLRSYVLAEKFVVHDFVVMPDHVHLLMNAGWQAEHRKSSTARQRRVFVPCEEGIGLPWRDLATWVPPKCGLMTGRVSWATGRTFTTILSKLAWLIRQKNFLIARFI